MINLLERLLAQLGLKHKAGTRSFAFDASLNSALVEQAELEQITPDELANDLVRRELEKRRRHEEFVNLWQALSPREQDATAFTCLGYTNRQIAAKMEVSPSTIKAYIRQILVKFDFHSKYELQINLGAWDFSKWGPEAQD